MRCPAVATRSDAMIVSTKQSTSESSVGISTEGPGLRGGTASMKVLSEAQVIRRSWTQLSGRGKRAWGTSLQHTQIPDVLGCHHSGVDTIVRRAALSLFDTYHPMKATMLRDPCHKYRQAGRAARSTGLVTASARGAARVTGDAPRSFQAATRFSDNYVAANNCAAIFTAAASTEIAAVMTATISKCAALFARTTRMVRHVGFEEIEEGLELRARAAARASNSYRVRRDGARRLANDRDLAQQTLVPCPDSTHPTSIDETER
jgi:hypothetical protein